MEINFLERRYVPVKNRNKFYGHKRNDDCKHYKNRRKHDSRVREYDEKQIRKYGIKY